MENILHYPDTTMVNKLVPKTTFYRHLEVNAKMRQHFVGDVVSITWLYKLAPSTLNVDDGKTVHEVVIFVVKLKEKNCPTDVFLFIDKNMPRHVVFILEYEGQYKLLLNYKEWKNEEQTEFAIIKSFSTEWVNTDKLSLPLSGQTLDKIYESFAGVVSGYGSTTSEETKRIIALQDEISKKLRQAEALQKRVRTEKQIARQMEMNNEARALKREIANLHASLNEMKK